jgi:single-strand DNA-binding protein
MGNVTGDPTEHRQDDGSTTVKLRIAVTGRYFNTASQDFSDRRTEFITVFARKSQGQNVLRSVRKGQPLVVTGRLNTSEWTGEDGVARFSLNQQAEYIGPDHTFGTSVFTRPLRAKDVPNVDADSGEILTSAGSADPEDALTDADEDEDSLAPAF